VQKYGCFVELFEVFVEGLLPITALEEAADARCVYREHDHAIVAVLGGDSGRGRRSGRGKTTMQLKWKLGDRIRVRAERIDPIRRRVEFALSSG
jgi:exoribonuclease R